MTNVIFFENTSQINICISEIQKWEYIMAKQLMLNALYAQFKNGLMDKRELEGMIYEKILGDINHYGLQCLTNEDCIDFLSWFYPRIKNAIDSYNSSTASFETYLGTLIKWSAREYISRHARQLDIEHAVWSARISEMYAHETEPEYYEKENSRLTKLNKKIMQINNPRQVLILILKCYYFLTEDYIERMAFWLDIDINKLKGMVDTLRQKRIEHDDEVRRLRESTYSQFYRCIIYEKKLKSFADETDLFLKTKKQLEKSRIRLASMKKRVASIRLEATNTQIA